MSKDLNIPNTIGSNYELYERTERDGERIINNNNPHINTRGVSKVSVRANAAPKRSVVKT